MVYVLPLVATASVTKPVLMFTLVHKRLEKKYYRQGIFHYISASRYNSIQKIRRYQKLILQTAV